jgi:hypothetical protein
MALWSPARNREAGRGELLEESLMTMGSEVGMRGSGRRPDS